MDVSQPELDKWEKAAKNHWRQAILPQVRNVDWDSLVRSVLAYIHTVRDSSTDSSPSHGELVEAASRLFRETWDWIGPRLVSPSDAQEYVKAFETYQWMSEYLTTIHVLAASGHPPSMKVSDDGSQHRLEIELPTNAYHVHALKVTHALRSFDLLQGLKIPAQASRAREMLIYDHYRHAIPQQLDQFLGRRHHGVIDDRLISLWSGLAAIALHRFGDSVGDLSILEFTYGLDRLTHQGFTACRQFVDGMTFPVSAQEPASLWAQPLVPIVQGRLAFLAPMITNNNFGGNYLDKIARSGGVRIPETLTDEVAHWVSRFGPVEKNRKIGGNGRTRTDVDVVVADPGHNVIGLIQCKDAVEPRLLKVQRGRVDDRLDEAESQHEATRDWICQTPWTEVCRALGVTGFTQQPEFVCVTWVRDYPGSLLQRSSNTPVINLFLANQFLDQVQDLREFVRLATNWEFFRENGVSPFLRPTMRSLGPFAMEIKPVAP